MATIREIIVRVRADVSQLQAGLNSASSSVSRAGRTMSRVGSSLQRNVSLPLIAAGAASVKMAYDFDESFVRIGALVGASQKQIQGYQREVLKLSEEVAQSPKDLADALYFITSSGFEGAQALKVLESSAKAAAAGLGDTVTVADAVTSAVNAYGPKMLDAATATDVLVGAVREGKGEASEMAGVIGRVIPLAAELGVSFKDVGAAMASMTLSGLDAAEATTALRGIFTTLLKPSQDGEQALKRLGLTVEDLRDSMAEQGLIETLLDLKDRLGDNKEAMAAIFPNVRALSGFLNLTGKNAQKNVGIFRSLRGEVDATGKAFNKTARSEGFKIRDALNELRIEAIKLGKELIPIIVDEVIPAFRAALRWWKRLDPATKDLAVKLAGLAILAGPLTRLAGGILKVVGALGKWAKVPPIPAGGGIPGGPGGLPAVPPTGLKGPLITFNVKLPVRDLELIETRLDEARNGVNDFTGAQVPLQDSIRNTNALLAQQGSAVRVNAEAFEYAVRAGVSYEEALEAVAKGGDIANASIRRAVEEGLNPFSKATAAQRARILAAARALDDMGGKLTKQQADLVGYYTRIGEGKKALAILRQAFRDAGGSADVAKADVKSFADSVKALPKTVRTRVEAITAQAENALEGILIDLNTISGQHTALVQVVRTGRGYVPPAANGAEVRTAGIVRLHAGELVVPRDRRDDMGGDRAIKVTVRPDRRRMHRDLDWDYTVRGH